MYIQERCNGQLDGHEGIQPGIYGFEYYILPTSYQVEKYSFNLVASMAFL